MLSKGVVTLTFDERQKKQHDCLGIREYKFSSSSKTIDRLENISYETFFTDYLNKNVPCIISIENIKTWHSSMDWIVDGKPNFDFLEQMFGNIFIFLIIAVILTYYLFQLMDRQKKLTIATLVYR